MNNYKKYYPYLLIGLLSLILNLMLHSFGSYDFIESKFHDMKFKLRGPLKSYYPENKQEDVVIVEIDDNSYSSISESYPYPRGNVYGRIIRNLTEAEAKVIVFDIMFDSEDHTSKIINQNLDDNCKECFFHDQDKLFKKSIKFANDNGTDVILAAKIAKDINRMPMDYLVSPNKQIMDTDTPIGLVNQGVDNSQTNRKYSIINQLSSEPENYYLSLALQSVLSFQDNKQKNNITQIDNSTIDINGLKIKTIKNEASIVMNFYGPVSNVFQTFKRFSLSQIIDTKDYTLSGYEDDDWMDMFINENDPRYSFFSSDKNFFKDKIVIIGSALEEDNDFIVSPFYSYQGIDSKMPGVELHANAIQQILDGNYINVSSTCSDINGSYFSFNILLFLLSIIIVTLFISNSNSSILSSLLVFLFSLIWFSYSIGCFLSDQFWILKLFYNYLFDSKVLYSYTFGDKVSLLPVFYPMATIISTYGLNLSYKLFKEQSDKNFLKLTFGKYVSPQIIDIMYKNKKLPELGGESGVRTAYFSDIESFSTISEQLSSKELVNLLNEYLSAQTEIILDYKGTLDKYEGDSIVAFFGAPIFFDNHAKAAIDAAVKCQNNLKQLNIKWENEDTKWPVIVHSMKMRTGVNSGDMVTGNMGSKFNMNYTMIGDVVNTASRLESSAKQYGIYLHSTEMTLNDAGRENYIWRYIDRIQFVGKTVFVQTIEVIDLIDSKNTNMKKLVDIFNLGLKFYYERNWDDAIKEFEKSLTLEYNHKVNPSKIYIERAKKYKKDEPFDDWKGITILNQK